MTSLPLRTYLFSSESQAREALEDIGVEISDTTEGQIKVTLDPILMVGFLALEKKNFPSVGKLIADWEKEKTQKGETGGKKTNTN
jgi:hypothetical protein